MDHIEEHRILRPGKKARRPTMKIRKCISKSLRRMNGSSPSQSSPGNESSLVRRSDSFESESNSATAPAGQDSKEVEPWRAERVRGDESASAPRESDWWKDPATTSQSDLDAAIMNDTSATSTLDTSNKEPSQRAVNDPEKFRNCGLETWELARAAWKQQKGKKAKDDQVREPTWSKKEVRKAVIMDAAFARTYEFPKQARLKHVVKSYDALWKAEAEEEADDPLLLFYVPFVGDFSISGR